MAKPKGGRGGRATQPPKTKVTVRIDSELATRLAVEAAMRHMSMGEVVEEVMGPRLRQWRLPSNVQVPTAIVADTAEDAA